MKFLSRYSTMALMALGLVGTFTMFTLALPPNFVGGMKLLPGIFVGIIFFFFASMVGLTYDTLRKERCIIRDLLEQANGRGDYRWLFAAVVTNIRSEPNMHSDLFDGLPVGPLLGLNSYIRNELRKKKEEFAFSGLERNSDEYFTIASVIAELEATMKMLDGIINRPAVGRNVARSE